jgi:ribosomal protein S12 methylthiotransferase
MDRKKYFLVSLGCAKNTVDSQSMAALLEQSGYVGTEKPNQAGILIVNTCGFIKPAIEESIQTLQDLAEHKRKGQILIATGCLTERYRDMVARQVPGVDGILGTRRWMDIVDVVQELRDEHRPAVLYHIPDAPTVGKDERGVMRAAIQGASSYLKIADGCRRPCAFCSIPLIKGTAVSRPLETILNEAETLYQLGVKELILIAQDTTDYGHDLGIKDGLAELLEKLVQRVPQLPWIRILYAYPGYVTDRLIQVMGSSPQILPYLDMPLQHAHPEILKHMRRPANMDWVHQTLGKMRNTIPGLALRTTFIVGFPGETETEFQTLLEFIEEIKFDHIGAFPYFQEHGTASEPFGDPVPQEIKEERIQRLMMLQEQISLTKNQSFVGKTLPVLIEGYNDGVSVGRSYRDAPEIDGLVFAEGQASVGEMVPVQISGAMVHDLTGQLVLQKAGR